MFTFGTKTTPTVFSITFWPIQTQPTTSPFAPSSVEYFAWRKQHQLEQNSLKEKASNLLNKSSSNPSEWGNCFFWIELQEDWKFHSCIQFALPKISNTNTFPISWIGKSFFFPNTHFSASSKPNTSWIKLWEQNLGKLGWLWRFFFFQIFFEVFFFQISCKILSLRVKMDSNPYICWDENQTRFI